MKMFVQRSGLAAAAVASTAIMLATPVSAAEGDPAVALTGAMALPASTAPEGAVGATASAAQSAEVRAAPVDCLVIANQPWYSSPSVYATASFSCDEPVDIVKFDVWLTRDGSTAGHTNQSWYFTTGGSDTAVGTNRTGNQKWCTRAEARFEQNGTVWYSTPVTQCENSGF